MDDKKAVAILIKLLNKNLLSTEEKEAVTTAIGILSWTSLSQSRVKDIRAKREKRTKW